MVDDSDVADFVLQVPSWQRWPPNCCQTCHGPWERSRDSEWDGVCRNAASLNYGERTDARFRCQDFRRKST